MNPIVLIGILGGAGLLGYGIYEITRGSTGGTGSSSPTKKIPAVMAKVSNPGSEPMLTCRVGDIVQVTAPIAATATYSYGILDADGFLKQDGMSYIGVSQGKEWTLEANGIVFGNAFQFQATAKGTYTYALNMYQLSTGGSTTFGVVDSSALATIVVA
jgi:hypothetical protein